MLDGQCSAGEYEGEILLIVSLNGENTDNTYGLNINENISTSSSSTGEQSGASGEQKGASGETGGVTGTGGNGSFVSGVLDWEKTNSFDVPTLSSVTQEIVEN